MIDQLTALARWTNENQGVVSVVIFVITIAFGWASGIFGALRHRPQFKIQLIPVPTVAATFQLGLDEDSRPLHRTAIALYVKIANVGTAAAGIDSVEVGYRWAIEPFSADWLRFRLGWFWIDRPTPSLRDFQISLGDDVQVFPFLFQRNQLLDTKVETHLEPGTIINGIVYFESPQCWGASFPFTQDGRMPVRVRILDSYGRRHTSRIQLVRVTTLQEARKCNDDFGNTNAAGSGIGKLPDSTSELFNRFKDANTDRQRGGLRKAPTANYES